MNLVIMSVIFLTITFISSYNLTPDIFDHSVKDVLAKLPDHQYISTDIRISHICSKMLMPLIRFTTGQIPDLFVKSDYKRDDYIEGKIHPVSGVSMLGELRLRNFYDAIYSTMDNIHSVVIEFGTWRSGSVILGSKFMECLGDNRLILGVDAFTKIQVYDYEPGKMDYIAVDYNKVITEMELFDSANNLKVIKGFFNEVEDQIRDLIGINDVSVLRLDSNSYETTSYLLKTYFHLLSDNGVIIFDDYNNEKWIRDAWIDFSTEMGLNHEVVKVDMFTSWWSPKIKILSSIFINPP